jgi:hypothetical protein
MASVEEHYDQVLSDHYSWMFGGLDSGLENNRRFFRKHNIVPHRNGVAIDLGAGCGFQSIPLANAGFSVTAIDLDAKLLAELKRHPEAVDITTVQDDLVNFPRYVQDKAELIVCMTDTLLHLASKDNVSSLFSEVAQRLDDAGKFIITFRDLTAELSELDRFIPVRSDQNTIFTCFLEYEPETVKVHDIVHTKNGNEWTLSKSFYRKLRLSKRWVDEQLSHSGFGHITSTVEGGLVTVIAAK